MLTFAPMTKQVSVFFAFAMAVAGCQPQEPSARDVFELRTQCNAMAESIRKEESDADDKIESLKGLSVAIRATSHYDVTTNRCLVTLAITGHPMIEGRYLIDGQSKVHLAGCTKTKPWECSIDHDQSTWEAVNAYIDKMMGADK